MLRAHRMAVLTSPTCSDRSGWSGDGVLMRLQEMIGRDLLARRHTALLLTVGTCGLIRNNRTNRLTPR